MLEEEELLEEELLEVLLEEEVLEEVLEEEVPPRSPDGPLTASSRSLFFLAPEARWGPLRGGSGRGSTRSCNY